MRNPKFIRISSNGLCDEVFKELLFTRNPHNVFQATIYFTWKLLEDYLPYASLCLSKCGKGASDILFQDALEVPTTVCRGGKQVSFFFYIPFNLFSYVSFYICIFLSSVRSQFFLLSLWLSFVFCVAWSFGHSFFFPPVSFNLFSWHCSLGDLS